MCVDLELRVGSSEVIAGEGTEQNQTKSIRVLKGTGIDWREGRLISNLYMDHSVKIRLDHEETRSVMIERGIRQGCCLSPVLFKLHGEYTTQEALEGFWGLQRRRTNDSHCKIRR